MKPASGCPGRDVGERERTEKPDHRRRQLLRPRRERPRHHAAERRDKRAAL
jgi:hypothetical protein